MSETGTVEVCARCGTRNAPTITSFVGLPPALRDEVKARVCDRCWGEWKGTQLMAINEYRLNLGREEHRAILADLAAEFLGLKPKDQPSGEGAEGTPSLGHLQDQWSPKDDEDEDL